MALFGRIEIRLRLREGGLLGVEEPLRAQIQEVRLLDREHDRLQGGIVGPVRREQRVARGTDRARAAPEVEK